MGKGLNSLILPAAAIGAMALTGGAAAPALAGTAGAGAAGAGLGTAGGLGLAGDALAAQGAAGLLGGAGAAAAGYGAPAAGFGSALGGTGAAELGTAAASELPAGMAAYGPNGEYVGSTIASDGLSANSFTGGYDALNPLQRGMQRLSGMDFNGKGLQGAQKGLGMMQGGQQQQPQVSAPAAPMQQRPQQAAGSFTDSSNINQQELEQLKRRAYAQTFGRSA